jgi:hypothetical protein
MYSTMAFAAPCGAEFSGSRTGRIACLALALVYPLQAVVASEPDSKINAFIAAEGFTPIDRDYFWSKDWNGPHRFSRYNGEHGIMLADYGLADAEKAILAIEALEPPLTHVRYKITSTGIPAKDDWLQPVRLVEVTRFNLAPTLFESVRQAYEGLFTPSDEDMEDGPHVTWRLAFMSNRFMSADPMAVSRRELRETEAQAEKCFALSCLDPADPIGEDWSWNDIAFDEDQYPSEYEGTDAHGLTVPARIVDLLQMAGEVRGHYDMVISSNVAEQDHTANGIIRYNKFAADEVSSDWIVRRQAGEVPPFWGQLRTARMAGEPVWTLPYDFDPGQIEWTHIPVEGIEAWKATFEFDDGSGVPIRYDAVFNREVATFRSDHWMYFSIAQFPAFVYARDPIGGTSLSLLERNPFPNTRVSLSALPNAISATGRNLQFDGYEAFEYSFVVSRPDAGSAVYPTWTGTFWAIADLPAAPGWFGLPSSPFAGRSWQFSALWQALGWDIAGRGLIVRADITLHDGLAESDLRPVLAGTADMGTLFDIGWGHQTVRMRLSALAPDPSPTLATLFPDLAPLGSEPWPYDLPPQTVSILERY